MASPCYLRCVGAPELRPAAGDVVRFRTRNHLALFVYFAMEPRVPPQRDQPATRQHAL
jgi:hypothetical protein